MLSGFAYDHAIMSAQTARLAEEIRRNFLHKPFGIIKFWGTAVVSPNLASYELVATHADGDRLDLVFVHESRSGLPGIISVWSPRELEAAPQSIGKGLAIRSATRLHLDDEEACADGTHYLRKSSRGEARFLIEGEPALVLAH